MRMASMSQKLKRPSWGGCTLGCLSCEYIDTNLRRKHFRLTVHQNCPPTVPQFPLQARLVHRLPSWPGLHHTQGEEGEGRGEVEPTVQHKRDLSRFSSQAPIDLNSLKPVWTGGLHMVCWGCQRGCRTSWWTTTVQPTAVILWNNTTKFNFWNNFRREIIPHWQRHGFLLIFGCPRFHHKHVWDACQPCDQGKIEVVFIPFVAASVKGLV